MCIIGEKELKTKMAILLIENQVPIWQIQAVIKENFNTSFSSSEICRLRREKGVGSRKVFSEKDWGSIVMLEKEFWKSRYDELNHSKNIK